MKDRLDSEGGEQIGEKFQQQVDDRHGDGMMALIAQDEKTGKSEPAHLSIPAEPSPPRPPGPALQQKKPVLG